MELCQEINLQRSLATDLAFHAFGNNDVALTLGMDSGSVLLYELNNFKSLEDTGDVFSLVTTLSKHEDWVRCVDFVTLGMPKVFSSTNWWEMFGSVLTVLLLI